MRHLSLMACLSQGVTDPSRAPVLPNNGRVNGTARLLVPDHHRLALIGHPDGGNVGDITPRGLNRLAQDRCAGGIDLFGIMLDPAILRIGLAKRPARGDQGLAATIKQDGTGAGGAVCAWRRQ